MSILAHDSIKKTTTINPPPKKSVQPPRHQFNLNFDLLTPGDPCFIELTNSSGEWNFMKNSNNFSSQNTNFPSKLRNPPRVRGRGFGPPLPLVSFLWRCRTWAVEDHLPSLCSPWSLHGCDDSVGSLPASLTFPCVGCLSEATVWDQLGRSPCHEGNEEGEERRSVNAVWSTVSAATVTANIFLTQSSSLGGL